MAVNISSNQDSMLEQMTSLAYRGYLDSALGVLEKSGLNEVQKNKIKTILTQPHDDTLEATQAMKQSMIAVIKGEDFQPAASGEQSFSSQPIQVLPLEQEDSITFTDTPTSLQTLPLDIIGVIFSTCISMCDLRTITAFPCMSKFWKQFTLNFFAVCDLKHICPELTVMDAKTQQRECADEPKIDKFQIFKAVKKIAPHVEDNAGVTLLTMIKDDNLKMLIEIATQDGMQIKVDDDIIEELGDVPVKQTDTILITNSVFIGTRDKDYKSQESLAEGHGCQIPTGQAYVALCVFTQKILQNCLYGKNGQNLPTYGHSSTSYHVLEIPIILAVGGSIPGQLSIDDDDFGSGAGGQWKF